MAKSKDNQINGSVVNLTIPFEHLRRKDVALVGGKNASLGEMIGNLAAEGISVPPGYATTSQAYWQYVEHNGIQDKIASLIAEWKSGQARLDDTGHAIRDLFLRGSWPSNIADEIVKGYHTIEHQTGIQGLSVAVRSSATAEDLPDASFAGQQESYLNISGVDALLHACKSCYASLFTDRAIGYRQAKGFDHLRIALSIGIQRMVRSDASCSGIMFSIDTKTASLWLLISLLSLGFTLTGIVGITRRNHAPRELSLEVRQSHGAVAQPLHLSFHLDNLILNDAK